LRVGYGHSVAANRRSCARLSYVSESYIKRLPAQAVSAMNVLQTRVDALEETLTQ